MDCMIDVENLSELERNKILQVLQKDERIQDAQNRKIRELNAQIQKIRRLGVLRSGDDQSKMCIRCRAELGLFFNRGDICHGCKFRVCNICQVALFSRSWLCILCYKQRQLKWLTGEWATFHQKPIRKWASGSDLVKASLRIHPGTSEPDADSSPSDTSPTPQRGHKESQNGGPLGGQDTSKHKMGYPKETDKHKLTQLLGAVLRSKKPEEDSSSQELSVKRVSSRRYSESDSDSSSSSDLEDSLSNQTSMRSSPLAPSVTESEIDMRGHDSPQSIESPRQLQSVLEETAEEDMVRPKAGVKVKSKSHSNIDNLTGNVKAHPKVKRVAAHRTDVANQKAPKEAGPGTVSTSKSADLSQCARIQTELTPKSQSDIELVTHAVRGKESVIVETSSRPVKDGADQASVGRSRKEMDTAGAPDRTSKELHSEQPVISLSDSKKDHEKSGESQTVVEIALPPTDIKQSFSKENVIETGVQSSEKQSKDAEWEHDSNLQLPGQRSGSPYSVSMDSIPSSHPSPTFRPRSVGEISIPESSDTDSVSRMSHQEVSEQSGTESQARDEEDEDFDVEEISKVRFQRISRKVQQMTSMSVKPSKSPKKHVTSEEPLEVSQRDKGPRGPRDERGSGRSEGGGGMGVGELSPLPGSGVQETISVSVSQTVHAEQPGKAAHLEEGLQAASLQHWPKEQDLSVVMRPKSVDELSWYDECAEAESPGSDSGQVVLADGTVLTEVEKQQWLQRQVIPEGQVIRTVSEADSIEGILDSSPAELFSTPQRQGRASTASQGDSRVFSETEMEGESMTPLSPLPPETFNTKSNTYTIAFMEDSDDNLDAESDQVFLSQSTTSDGTFVALKPVDFTPGRDKLDSGEFGLSFENSFKQGMFDFSGNTSPQEDVKDPALQQEVEQQQMRLWQFKVDSNEVEGVDFDKIFGQAVEYLDEDKHKPVVSPKLRQQAQASSSKIGYVLKPDSEGSTDSDILSVIDEESEYSDASETSKRHKEPEATEAGTEVVRKNLVKDRIKEYQATLMDQRQPDIVLDQPSHNETVHSPGKIKHRYHEAERLEASVQGVEGTPDVVVTQDLEGIVDSVRQHFEDRAVGKKRDEELVIEVVKARKSDPVVGLVQHETSECPVYAAKTECKNDTEFAQSEGLEDGMNGHDEHLVIETVGEVVEDEITSMKKEVPKLDSMNLGRFAGMLIEQDTNVQKESESDEDSVSGGSGDGFDVLDERLESRDTALEQVVEDDIVSVKKETPKLESVNLSRLSEMVEQEAVDISQYGQMEDVTENCDVSESFGETVDATDEYLMREIVSDGAMNESFGEKAVVTDEHLMRKSVEGSTKEAVEDAFISVRKERTKLESMNLGRFGEMFEDITEKEDRDAADEDEDEDDNGLIGQVHVTDEHVVIEKAKEVCLEEVVEDEIISKMKERSKLESVSLGRLARSIDIPEHLQEQDNISEDDVQNETLRYESDTIDEAMVTESVEEEEIDEEIFQDVLISVKTERPKLESVQLGRFAKILVEQEPTDTLRYETDSEDDSLGEGLGNEVNIEHRNTGTVTEEAEDEVVEDGIVCVKRERPVLEFARIGNAEGPEAFPRHVTENESMKGDDGMREGLGEQVDVLDESVMQNKGLVEEDMVSVRKDRPELSSVNLGKFADILVEQETVDFLRYETDSDDGSLREGLGDQVTIEHLKTGTVTEEAEDEVVVDDIMCEMKERPKLEFARILIEQGPGAFPRHEAEKEGMKGDDDVGQGLGDQVDVSDELVMKEKVQEVMQEEGLVEEDIVSERKDRPKLSSVNLGKFADILVEQETVDFLRYESDSEDESLSGGVGDQVTIEHLKTGTMTEEAEDEVVEDDILCVNKERPVLEFARILIEQGPGAFPRHEAEKEGMKGDDDVGQGLGDQVDVSDELVMKEKVQEMMQEDGLVEEDIVSERKDRPKLSSVNLCKFADILVEQETVDFLRYESDSEDESLSGGVGDQVTIEHLKTGTMTEEAEDEVVEDDILCVNKERPVLEFASLLIEQRTGAFPGHVPEKEGMKGDDGVRQGLGDQEDVSDEHVVKEKVEEMMQKEGFVEEDIVSERKDRPKLDSVNLGKFADILVEQETVDFLRYETDSEDDSVREGLGDQVTIEYLTEEAEYEVVEDDIICEKRETAELEFARILIEQGPDAFLRHEAEKGLKGDDGMREGLGKQADVADELVLKENVENVMQEKGLVEEDIVSVRKDRPKLESVFLGRFAGIMIEQEPTDTLRYETDSEDDSFREGLGDQVTIEHWKTGTATEDTEDDEVVEDDILYVTKERPKLEFARILIEQGPGAFPRHVAEKEGMKGDNGMREGLRDQVDVSDQIVVKGKVKEVMQEDHFVEENHIVSVRKDIPQLSSVNWGRFADILVEQEPTDTLRYETDSDDDSLREGLGNEVNIEHWKTGTMTEDTEDEVVEDGITCVKRERPVLEFSRIWNAEGPDAFPRHVTENESMKGDDGMREGWGIQDVVLDERVEEEKVEEGMQDEGLVEEDIVSVRKDRPKLESVNLGSFAGIMVEQESTDTQRYERDSEVDSLSENSGVHVTINHFKTDTVTEDAEDEVAEDYILCMVKERPKLEIASILMEQGSYAFPRNEAETESMKGDNDMREGSGEQADVLDERVVKENAQEGMQDEGLVEENIVYVRKETTKLSSMNLGRFAEILVEQEACDIPRYEEERVSLKEEDSVAEDLGDQAPALDEYLVSGERENVVFERSVDEDEIISVKKDRSGLESINLARFDEELEHVVYSFQDVTGKEFKEESDPLKRGTVDEDVCEERITAVLKEQSPLELESTSLGRFTAVEKSDYNRRSTNDDISLEDDREDVEYFHSDGGKDMDSTDVNCALQSSDDEVEEENIVPFSRTQEKTQGLANISITVTSVHGDSYDYTSSIESSDTESEADVNVLVGNAGELESASVEPVETGSGQVGSGHGVQTKADDSWHQTPSGVSGTVTYGASGEELSDDVDGPSGISGAQDAVLDLSSRGSAHIGDFQHATRLEEERDQSLPDMRGTVDSAEPVKSGEHVDEIETTNSERRPSGKIIEVNVEEQLSFSIHKDDKRCHSIENIPARYRDETESESDDEREESKIDTDGASDACADTADHESTLKVGEDQPLCHSIAEDRSVVGITVDKGLTVHASETAAICHSIAEQKPLKDVVNVDRELTVDIGESSALCQTIVEEKPSKDVVNVGRVLIVDIDESNALCQSIAEEKPSKDMNVGRVLIVDIDESSGLCQSIAEEKQFNIVNIDRELTVNISDSSEISQNIAQDEPVDFGQHPTIQADDSEGVASADSQWLQESSSGARSSLDIMDNNPLCQSIAEGKAVLEYHVPDDSTICHSIDENIVQSIPGFQLQQAESGVSLHGGTARADKTSKPNPDGRSINTGIHRETIVIHTKSKTSKSEFGEERYDEAGHRISGMSSLDVIDSNPLCQSIAEGRNVLEYHVPEDSSTCHSIDENQRPVLHGFQVLPETAGILHVEALKTEPARQMDDTQDKASTARTQVDGVSSLHVMGNNPLCQSIAEGTNLTPDYYVSEDTLSCHSLDDDYTLADSQTVPGENQAVSTGTISLQGDNKPKLAEGEGSKDSTDLQRAKITYRVRAKGAKRPFSASDVQGDSPDSVFPRAVVKLDVAQRSSSPSLTSTESQRVIRVLRTASQSSSTPSSPELSVINASSPISAMESPRADAPASSRASPHTMSESSISQDDSGHASGGSRGATPEHKRTDSGYSQSSIPSSLSTVTDRSEEEEDIDKIVASIQSTFAGSRGNLLSVVADSRESIASFYSDAGDIAYSKIPVTGEILFALIYNYKSSMLEVAVKQCRDIAAVDAKRNRSDPYVKTYLLPDKTRSGKRKTKVKKHTLSPIFDETLKYPISQSELENRTLWVTVWHNDRFGRNDFLGEVTINFDYYKFEDPFPRWYPLQERHPNECFKALSHHEKSPRSRQQLDPQQLSMMTYKGDLILSIRFVPGDKVTKETGTPRKGNQKKDSGNGQLQVTVKEARNLTAVRSNGFSDPFCKGYLLPERHKHSKQKTPVKKKDCNPVWNHTFTFDDISLSELRERCLELTIWDHEKLSSNDFLGGSRLNLGTGLSQGKPVDWMDAKGEEMSLWQAMMDRPNIWIDGSLALRPNMEKRKF